MPIGSRARVFKFGVAPVLGLALVGAASCIALIDKNADQCAVDSDCTAKGGAFAGRVCRKNVCVVGPAENDAALDSSITGDAKDDAHETPDTFAPPQDADAKSDSAVSDHGLFLVSGNTIGGGVLVAIDPDTGNELSNETKSVAAIAYDPGLTTGGGDVWYVFENAAGTLDGGSAATKLLARRFDAESKTWTELGSAVDVPKPKSPRDVVVLNKRIVYMADYVGADPLGVGLIYLIDISDSTAPKLVCVSCGAGPANKVTKGVSTDKYLGFVAGGRADDTLTGGNFGVAFVQACTDTGGTCPTFFQRYRYTSNDGTDIPASQASFGSFGADVTVGVGTSYRQRAAFMAVPTTATTGTLLQNPQTFSGAPTPAATFTFSGRATFSPVVIAGCEDVALFTTFDGQLHAVPYGSKGYVATAIGGESASQLAFDTHTNVVAYMSNGLKAARVSTTSGLALTTLAWPATTYVPTAIRGREPGNGCIGK